MNAKCLILSSIVFVACLLATDVSAATISVPPKFISGTGLSNGLVGYWTFDGKDVPNGVVRDLSGNGNHGTLSGIATSTFYVPGKIGQGFRFDMVDDYVNAGSATSLDNIELQGGGGMTISAWIKPRSNGEGAIGIIYGKGSVQTSFVLTATDLRFIKDFDGAQNLDGATTADVVTFDQWQHVVVTWPGTALRSDLKFYKNGVSVGAGGGNSDGVGSAVSDASNSVHIGGNTGTNTFDGSIDDVRVYNRVLSAAEVTKLYNQTSGSKQNATPRPLAGSGLVGHWTFDGKDVVNGVARDVSGNGNHGNLVSIATSTFYTLGKLGQGFRFDGVDDYVGVTSSGLRLTGDLTLSIWANASLFGSGTYNNTFFSMTGAATENAVDNWLYYFSVDDGTHLLRAFHESGSGVDDGIVSTAGATSVTTNTWNHYVVVRNTTANTYTFYVNGIQIGAAVSYSADPTGGSSAALRIGQHSITSTNIWKGLLDDARIYSRALSAAEITELYNQTSGSKQNATPRQAVGSGLVGYWTFDGKDVVNGVARDVSGNGNHGNLISIATSTFYTLGKIGQGFRFDGTDDRINTGPTSMTGATSMSFSTWVYVGGEDFDGTYRYLVDNQSGNYTLNGFAIFLDDRGGSDPTNGLTYQIDVASGAASCVGAEVENLFAVRNWYHIVLTYNGDTSTEGIYVNGVAKSTSGGACSGSGAFVPDTNANLYLGSLNNSTSNSFKGKMDDTRLYSRALSASEVTQLYNLGR